MFLVGGLGRIVYNLKSYLEFPPLKLQQGRSNLDIRRSMLDACWYKEVIKSSKNNHCFVSITGNNADSLGAL